MVTSQVIDFTAGIAASSATGIEPHILIDLVGSKIYQLTDPIQIIQDKAFEDDDELSGDGDGIPDLVNTGTDFEGAINLDGGIASSLYGLEETLGGQNTSLFATGDQMTDASLPARSPTVSVAGALGDGELHLSTIFTELRLKKYIELRSLDACEWDCHCAGPAFFTGLLYGNLDETFEIIKDWDKDEIKNAYAESCKKGLRTEINRKDILFWSIKLLQISKKGLEKRSYLNENGKKESVFLKNIENILKNNLTKAEEYLNNFKK